MNATPKTISVAVLVTLGLTLAAGAAEPPKPEAPTDLDKLVGQPVDLAPWAYAWRADREVQEKPEAYFIPRRLERLYKVYRTVWSKMTETERAGNGLVAVAGGRQDLFRPLKKPPNFSILPF